MALHKTITQRGIYFITFTCYHWLHLFEKVSAFDLIYNWFDILVARSHFLTDYVIMPNHLHLLLYFHGGSQSLNTIIGNGKRFIGYEIVNRLGAQSQFSLLEQLQSAVRPLEKTRGKKHEIWQDSFDAKECRTEKFVLQKLNYIHNNPCVGKWKLVSEPHHYPHSSALFYLNGKTSCYPVRDYRDFLWIYRDHDES